MRRHLARVDGLPHGAARLPIVAAIAEAAVAQQRPDLDECLLDRLRRDMREAEHLEAGRIDDPTPAVALGQRIQRGCDVVCRPVESASEIVAVFACACGAMALRIVVLPIPDWPIRTVRRRARMAGAALTSSRAESDTTG